MKVIGSDFDGTITTGKIILESTRKKIKEFRDGDNIFIIVTGRSVSKFKEGIKKYNIDFFDYVICANGSIILDSNLNCIEKNMLSYKTVESVLNILLDKKNKQIILNTEENSYQITKKKDFRDINEPILSISLVFDSIEDRDAYSLDKLSNLSVYSNNIYTDISANNISKANSILKLFSYIKGDDLYTIGDGENDMDMLKVTENSYTFNSSLKCVKKSAKHIRQSIDEILDEINHA